MIDLFVIPYVELSGKSYLQEVRLVINKRYYQNRRFQEGKITLSISNCHFEKITIVNSEEIDFPEVSICFTDCSIKNIEVESIVTNNVSILFNSSIVAGRINGWPIRAISFNNCILNDNFFLQNLDNVSISYTEENIFPKRWKALFDSIGVADFIGVLRRKQSYYVYDCSRITISSNAKENTKGGFYRRRDGRTEDSRIGYRLTPEQASLLNLNLSLKYDLAKEYAETKVTGIVLNSVSISGSPTGKVSFENTKIGNWYLHDFIPKGEVSFYNISSPSNQKKSSKIEFHKSNLDNTWFDNTDFAEYSLVSFYRTKFSRTVFTSCSFPANTINFEKFTSLQNIHYPDQKSDGYYKDQYEVFLQLKMALEATGNFYEGQKLFAISNDSLRKIKEVPAWDKFILWVNRNSNNHGLSIKKPLLLFLGFTIGLYILYLWSLGRIFNRNEIDWTLVGYYFSFIDLTHRNDFLVDKAKFNLWSLTIDYLGKVLVGFFVYQFVAAFRKYGKK